MMELYAIRRGGYENETVKALIRHGVLIPIQVTVRPLPETFEIDTTTESGVPSEVKPGVPEVDWTGGKK